MADVILQFDPSLRDDDGRIWVARVCGRVAADSLWEGWIEFEPQGDGITLRTPAETKQPNRADLEYWATGLTVSYLEGALDRARYPESPERTPLSAPERPDFDRPAAPSSGRVGHDAPAQLRPNAVLDPFEVYAQGEDVLHQELRALDEGHLRNIIRAYGFLPDKEAELDVANRESLAERIVAAVRGGVT